VKLSNKRKSRKSKIAAAAAAAHEAKKAIALEVFANKDGADPSANDCSPEEPDRLE